MCKLDPVLSLDGDEAIEAFCNAEDRNDQAQRELKHYEATHRFLFVHAITMQHQLIITLEEQASGDVESFTQSLYNSMNSLNRYRSKLNQNQYKDELERLAWLKKIEDYTNLIELMKKIIQGQAATVKH